MMGKKTIIQFVLSGFASVIAFIALSLSARFFGPAIIGQIAYLTGLLGLVFGFSDLGLSRTHVHYTASLANAKTTLGVLLSLKLPLLIICGLASLVLGKVAGQASLIFLILIFNEVFSRLADSLLVTFEGQEKVIPQNLLRLAVKLVKLLAIIAIGLTLKTAFGFSLTLIIESATILLLSIWLCRRFLPLAFNRGLAKDYLIYSLPFFLVMPLSYFQDNGLVLIIRHFWAARELGFYSASLGLFGFLKDFSGALMIFFFPAISRLFSHKDFPAIQNYTDLAVKFSFWLLLPLLTIVFLLRHWLILIALGSQFLPAVPVFSWLLLGVLILAVFSPYSYVLYATRNHRAIVWVNLLTTILVLSLSWLIVPRFGGSGAAVAAVIGWLVGSLIQLEILHRRTGINFCWDLSLKRKEVKYLRELIYSFSKTSIRTG